MDKSCWYNLNVKECLKGTGKGLTGEYGKELQKFINTVPDGKVIDLGCGSGKTSQFFNDYTGVDLPSTIKSIGKELSPDVNFIGCDLIKEDISFLKEYDIIFMDAFIDVMKNPLWVLEKILKNSKNYILLIRQEIGKETKVTKNPSYGGWTYHSIIGINELYELLEKYNIRIVQMVNTCVGGNWKHILLKNEN